jgi:hypothetical protein
MKSFLKILPVLIVLPILVHVSCTSVDIDDLQLPEGGVSSSSEGKSGPSSSSKGILSSSSNVTSSSNLRSSSSYIIYSSSSLASGNVLCIVGTACTEMSQSACDAFGGNKVTNCDSPSISSSGNRPSSSSSAPPVTGTPYCYDSYGFEECIIIGIVNIIYTDTGHTEEFYFRDTIDCTSKNGTLVDRAWCVAHSSQIFDD